MKRASTERSNDCVCRFGRLSDSGTSSESSEPKTPGALISELTRVSHLGIATPALLPSHSRASEAHSHHPLSSSRSSPCTVLRVTLISSHDLQLIICYKRHERENVIPQLGLLTSRRRTSSTSANCARHNHQSRDGTGATCTSQHTPHVKELISALEDTTNDAGIPCA